MTVLSPILAQPLVPDCIGLAILFLVILAFLHTLGSLRDRTAGCQHTEHQLHEVGHRMSRIGLNPASVLSRFVHVLPSPCKGIRGGRIARLRTDAGLDRWDRRPCENGPYGSSSEPGRRRPSGPDRSDAAHAMILYSRLDHPLLAPWVYPHPSLPCPSAGSCGR
jgi:hypothetical protein